VDVSLVYKFEPHLPHIAQPIFSDIAAHQSLPAFPRRDLLKEMFLSSVGADLVLLRLARGKAGRNASASFRGWTEKTIAMDL
jgi:hypothetical protein